MTTAIQTSEKTFNKKIKAQVNKLMPATTGIRKTHIAGIGYVRFMMDSEKNILGKVFKEVGKGMMIYVD